MTDTAITHPDNHEPVSFSADELGWLPWLQPLAEADLTERHWAGLVDKSRSKSEYFMLLARDPEVLGARTRTDKDIFYNTKGGLPRAERELAAAVSRLNGCIFCASVHARFAIHHLKRADEVTVLLDEGIPSPLRGRNGAVVSAAAALSQTPPGFSAANAASLLDTGFDVQEQVDMLLSAAFFNWANRLMLSIGEPAPAAA
ncbi:MAG: alkylhydroperoxidase domain protein [Cypionkella sp.]